MSRIKSSLIIIIFSISSILTAEINYKDLVPVYRHYKKANKKHLYSTDKGDRKMENGEN